jgi:hypothetical protein
MGLFNHEAAAEAQYFSAQFAGLVGQFRIQLALKIGRQSAYVKQ